MRTTKNLMVKPLTVTVITSKDKSQKYIKILGLTPLENVGENTLLCKTNQGDMKFTTIDIFDNLTGYEEVVKKAENITSIEFNGYWSQGSFNVLSINKINCDGK